MGTFNAPLALKTSLYFLKAVHPQSRAFKCTSPTESPRSCSGTCRMILQLSDHGAAASSQSASAGHAGHENFKPTPPGCFGKFLLCLRFHIGVLGTIQKTRGSPQQLRSLHCRSLRSAGMRTWPRCPRSSWVTSASRSRSSRLCSPWPLMMSEHSQLAYKNSNQRNQTSSYLSGCWPAAEAPRP